LNRQTSKHYLAVFQKAVSTRPNANGSAFVGFGAGSVTTGCGEMAGGTLCAAPGFGRTNRIAPATNPQTASPRTFSTILGVAAPIALAALQSLIVAVVVSFSLSIAIVHHFVALKCRAQQSGRQLLYGVNGDRPRRI
jgi:hypothetical protein